MNENNDGGLIVYPAPGLGEAQWKEIRELMERLAWETSEKEALCKLRFLDPPTARNNWLDTVNAAAEDYRGRPCGPFHTNAFLYVDQQCIRTILAAQADGDTGRKTKPPYLFAIDQAIGDPSTRWRGWFKLHLESMGELFRCVEGDSLTPRELGEDVKEDEVFMSITQTVSE